MLSVSEIIGWAVGLITAIVVDVAITLTLPINPIPAAMLGVFLGFVFCFSGILIGQGKDLTKLSNWRIK